MKENSVSQIIKRIYLDSVAENLCEQCEESDTVFKDNPANRIAREIVSQFLLDHYLDHTAICAHKETKGVIKQRFDHSWLAKKLDYDPNYTVLSQLLHKSPKKQKKNDKKPNLEQKEIITWDQIINPDPEIPIKPRRCPFAERFEETTRK